jgi:hypothetical protein
VSPRVEDWQEESRMIASLRDVSVIEFVRSKGPIEIKAKRAEAESLQEKVNQLLAEAAHVEAIMLAAGVTPAVVHTNGARRPDQAEACAA